MKRYSEYRGANTTMGCLARECHDGEWVKYKDCEEEMAKVQVEIEAMVGGLRNDLYYKIEEIFNKHFKGENK